VSTAVDPQPNPATTVEQARCSWLAASDQASALAAELFQPGSGYGCPEAEAQDRHRLETARSEAERRFREYQDLERQHTQRQMLQLQRSQQLATWASFCVAAAVGVATIVGIIMQAAK
jgi:hypothetical protein